MFAYLDSAGLFNRATGLADRAAAYPESLIKLEFVDTLTGLQISAQYHSFDFFLKHGGERFRPQESQCGRIVLPCLLGGYRARGTRGYGRNVGSHRDQTLRGTSPMTLKQRERIRKEIGRAHV